MYKILGKKKVNRVVEQMTIHAPLVTKRCQPGQFIILRVNELGERIPLTIADFDRKQETITIVYQIVGYTTALLSNLKAGDSLVDLVGPLGQPKPFNNFKRVLGIGGGVGTAPLYPQLKQLFKHGVEIDTVIGARSYELLVLEDELKNISNRLFVVTDDGSKGSKGYVTDKLKELLECGEEYDEVIAIGPLAMMEAVVAITKSLDIPTSVSLNPLMIDGTGMCGGCRVTIAGEVKFACIDGPDFDGFLVDFRECIARQNYYRAEEHECKLALKGSIEHEKNKN